MTYHWSDRDWRDWYDEEVTVLGPFWTMDYVSFMSGSGDFILTADFDKWCHDNLAHSWEVCSGFIRCSTEDAVLLRLYSWAVVKSICHS